MTPNGVTVDRRLMCAHIEALFAHDNDGQLVRVNEPNGAPAPRFFLGRTGEGPVWRFRYDVEPVLRRGLEVAIAEDDSRDAFASPVMPSPYQEILRRAAPVEKTWTGPTLYSTSWHNESSRAVARKLGLIQFGSDLHIT